MLARSIRRQLSSLDVPTLAFVAVCIAALLGLFLIFAWLQERNVRALAWWGAAYLIGASSMALWARRRRCSPLPPELPHALIFIACGMIWNGVRLFHGRRLLPIAAFAGALVWLVALPAARCLPPPAAARVALGARGRRDLHVLHRLRAAAASGASRSIRAPLPIVVPLLHAAIFLIAARHAALCCRTVMRAELARPCSRSRPCSTRSAPPSSCC